MSVDRPNNSDEPGAWSKEALAIVAASPVPQTPSADLRDVLIPVEEDGHIVDWLMAMPASAGLKKLKAYWDWSRTWAAFWPIGSLASVASLLERFSNGSLPDRPELVRLLNRVVTDPDDVVVSAFEADAIVAEVVALAGDLASATETGLGLFDDMVSRQRTHGIARAWPPTHGDVILAETHLAAVILREGFGIVVRHGAPNWRELQSLRFVDLRGERPLLVGAEGVEVELSPAEARPISWLLPRSLLWHVEPISLADVWQPLLTGIPAALQAARESGRGMRITTRSRIVA